MVKRAMSSHLNPEALAVVLGKWEKLKAEYYKLNKLVVVPIAIDDIPSWAQADAQIMHFVGHGIPFEEAFELVERMAIQHEAVGRGL